MSNIFIGLKIKNDLFGCFRIREERDKDNETSLKEGEGIEIENLQCFSILRDARSLFRILYIYTYLH